MSNTNAATTSANPVVNTPTAAATSAPKSTVEYNAPANAGSINEASVGVAKVAPSSELPELVLDQQEEASNLTAVAHGRAQIKRLMTKTWLRIVLILSAVVAVLVFIFLFNALSSDPIIEASGGIDTNSIMLNEQNTGRDNLNPAQASYLMDLQRQEARLKADSGESNAAAIELPRASLQGVDANATSDASAFAPGSIKNQYTAGEEAQKARLDLANNPRYEQASGGYYLDKETNQIVTQGANGPQSLQNATSNNQPPQNATYNTNQNGGGNQNYQDGSNGGNANNGGGGDANTAAAAPEQPRERTPDADLPIIQQRLYDAYNQQEAERNAAEERIEQMRQQNLSQAQQLENQRRQLAAQSIAEQMNQSSQRGQASNGFSSKSYAPKAAAENESNNSNSNNNSNSSSNNNYSQVPSGFVKSAYTNDSSYSNQGSNNNGSTQSRPPALLDRNIMRAGTSWPVLITKSVNTDEGLQVIGMIVGGPFNGATTYGTVQPAGRNIGVVFTRIEPVNKRKPIVPLNALAMTLGSQKQAVASKVKNHHLQNYSVIALESVVGGYGDAYSNQNETTIDRADGTTITSKGETTQKEVTANILSRFSDRLSNDITRLGDRAPTYTINQGTVLNMVLLSNMDIYATTDDISLASPQGGGQRSTL